MRHNADVSRPRMTHHAYRAIVVGAGIILSLAIGSASAQVFSVPSSPAKADYYVWITFLTEGSVDWITEDEAAQIQGRVHRVVVTTSEIYDNVYIETLSVGREGCCKKLERVRKFGFEAFCKKIQCVGEQSGFEFVRWLSETSFVFRYHDREYVMSAIDKREFNVEPKTGG